MFKSLTKFNTAFDTVINIITNIKKIGGLIVIMIGLLLGYFSQLKNTLGLPLTIWLSILISLGIVAIGIWIFEKLKKKPIVATKDTNINQISNIHQSIFSSLSDKDILIMSCLNYRDGKFYYEYNYRKIKHSRHISLNDILNANSSFSQVSISDLPSCTNKICIKYELIVSNLTHNAEKSIPLTDVDCCVYIKNGSNTIQLDKHTQEIEITNMRNDCPFLGGNGPCDKAFDDKIVYDCEKMKALINANTKVLLNIKLEYFQINNPTSSPQPHSSPNPLS
jgi:hypothetical protein